MAEKINLNAYVRGSYDRYQQIILKRFGFVKFDDHYRQLLTNEAQLLCENQTRPRHMLMSLIDFLMSKKIEIPTYNTLSDFKDQETLIHHFNENVEDRLNVQILLSNLNSDNAYHLATQFLDEIFKGTNTIERIAAGKAVLSHLSKNDNIVFVSTHDIELTTLLIDDYELFHFSEEVENDNVIFDYKLKSGELKTRNAIRILEINGYPPDLIEEAKKISHQIIKVSGKSTN